VSSAQTVSRRHPEREPHTHTLTRVYRHIVFPNLKKRRGLRHRQLVRHREGLQAVGVCKEFLGALVIRAHGVVVSQPQCIPELDRKSIPSFGCGDRTQEGSLRLEDTIRVNEWELRTDKWGDVRMIVFQRRNPLPGGAWRDGKT